MNNVMMLKTAQPTEKYKIRRMLEEARQHSAKKEWKKALDALKIVLDIDPKHRAALHLMMEANKSLGRHQQALHAAIRLLHIDKKQPDLLTYVGERLVDAEKYDEALPYLRLACTIDLTNAYPFFWAGAILVERKKAYDEAEPLLKHALALKNYRRGECFYQLFVIANSRDDVNNSLYYIGQAIETLDRTTPKAHEHEKYYIKLFIEVAKKIQSEAYYVFNTLTCRFAVMQCLQSTLSDYSMFTELWISILKQDSSYSALFNASSTLEDMISLRDDAFFLEGLQKLLFQDFAVEATICRVRAALLSQCHTMTQSEALAWMPFALPLACQSFFNEYIVAPNEEERALLTPLLRKIDEPFDEVSLFTAILVGCYMPLSRHEQPEQLASAMKNTATACGKEMQQLIHQVIKIQIEDHSVEQKLKESIPALKPIHDQVSLKVQAQYEEHPYPRWQYADMKINGSYKAFIDALCASSNRTTEDMMVSDHPNVLIAGCGTGEQVVHTVHNYQPKHVLALDLSRASIAYAKRKSMEYQMDECVAYMHGDLLDLDALDEQFDLVQCTGVLHHMEDPMQGWHAINRRLRSGGVMHVALYSEQARASVNEARRIIKERGIEPTYENISAFRQEIIQLPSDNPLRTLSKFIDFFTTSELRDLLFHVQEHQFTIPKIKACIETLGLKFLGFQFSSSIVTKHFIETYGKEAITNLDVWHEYELAHPNSFSGMYQVWLHKPA